MKLAKYSVIVTIDADLENPPELIPELVEKAEQCDILVASRTKLPRISEKLASGTLGKLLASYRNDEVYGFVFEEVWLDIGSFESYNEANEYFTRL